MLVSSSNLKNNNLELILDKKYAAVAFLKDSKLTANNQNKLGTISWNYQYRNRFSHQTLSYKKSAKKTIVKVTDFRVLSRLKSSE